jgi:hypothetical protein
MSSDREAPAGGGEVVTPSYPEGDLEAVFRDPAGSLIGAWQHGRRA